MTRKYARSLGPSIGLGSLASDEKKPRSKIECKRKHTWGARNIYHRRCSRCGLEMERTATGDWIRISLPPAT